MEEYLTLILNEDHIEVNKRKLASKSHYFRSLFSHNFNDSHKKDYIINYDIALCTLQNFVDWIHDENFVITYYHSIKISMTKFVQNSFMELLNLLQLSILFMVDELTNEITDILILCWLLPEKIIDIWLLAQELNIKVLRDVCLSVCLDRFVELPISPLIELNKDNITQLIANVNLRSCTKYIHFIRSKWIKHHMTKDIIDIKEERQPKFLQGIVVYETCKDTNKIAHLYTWDGNILSKCVHLENIQYPGKWLIGMQVISRGFSIYTVGGEMGLGTGQFNEIIWRYCLLSKKWYYQAKLPVPRRHMVVAFLRNKLVIVGGVGRHRLKLCSVDIFNVHTDKWEKGANVPETFTDVPPHCVLNSKLVLLKSSIYIYCLETNHWQTISIYNNPIIQRVDAFLTPSTTLFVIGNNFNETILSRITAVKDSVCKREECLKQYVDHNVITDMDMVYEDDLYKLRYVQVAGVGIMIINVHQDEECQYLHLHAEVKDSFKNFSIPKSGFLKIMNPDTLYDTM